MSHELPGRAEKDAERDRALAEVGFTTLRFSSWEVLNRISDVSSRIEKWIEAHASVPPPARQRRRKVVE